MENQNLENQNEQKTITIKFIYQNKDPYYKSITHFDQLTDSEKNEYFDICFRMKMKISKMRKMIDKYNNKPVSKTYKTQNK